MVFGGFFFFWFFLLGLVVGCYGVYVLVVLGFFVFCCFSGLCLVLFDCVLGCLVCLFFLCVLFGCFVVWFFCVRVIGCFLLGCLVGWLFVVCFGFSVVGEMWSVAFGVG